MNGYLKKHSWIVAGLAGVALVLSVACGGEDSDSASIAGGRSDDDAQNSSIITSSGEIVGDGASSEGGVAAPAGNIAPADQAAGPESAPGTLPAMLDRKIILTATLALETDEVSKRFEDVGNIAASNGGFVASSSFGTAEGVAVGDEDAKPRQTASLTIRVPSENYQRAVVELRKLGEVKDVDTGSNDVTEEFTDLESRLRGLRAVETQYMDFLARAVTIDEVLIVQDRLNGVRVEMEQVQGRINLFANQTDLATITIHLEPPLVAATEPKPESGSVTPMEALVNGWEASLAVLGGIAVVVLAVVAFSWWLVPLGVLAVFVARKLSKPTDKGRAPDAPPSAPVA